MTAPPTPERDSRPTPDHDPQGGLGVEERLRRVERELLEAGRELSRVHRELEAQRERSKQERAEREELLSVVSHELRTPVTVIGGYSRLLLSEEVGPLNREQRKFLEESQKSCRRLDAFIEKLLVASEAARGHDILEVGRARLAPVLQGVAEMFRPMLDEGDLRLSLDLADEPAEARFDRLRLEQVLGNLVGNAVKFLPPGGSIEIATRGVETPDDAFVKRWVEISVSDDGPGIPAADRDRAFEPYVQLGGGGGNGGRGGSGGRGGRSGGGLGLGLAICKRLVEAHGGRIQLEERVGGGCCFRFTLPVDAPHFRESA